MDNKTMLKRLEAGYEPIDISIEKWNDFERGYVAGVEEEDSCALCHVNHMNCSRCPIVLSGEKACTLSLDSAYHKACIQNDPSIMLDVLYKTKKWIEEQKYKKGKETPKKLTGVKYRIHHESDGGLEIRPTNGKHANFTTPDDDGGNLISMLNSLEYGDNLYIVSGDMVKNNL